MSRNLMILLGAVALSACAGAEGIDPLSPEVLEPAASALISGQVADAEGHVLLVTEALSGAVWLVDLDAEGGFSLEVPSSTYAIALLDSALRPVALYESPEEETLLDLAGEVALGTLAVDTRTYTLSTTAAADGPSASRDGKKDFSDLGGVQTGKHAGGGNGVDVVTMRGTNGDIDGDGVPDVLDNDSNENGIYDTNEGRTLCRGRLESYVGTPGIVPESAWDVLDEVHCAFFDNLKLSAMVAPGGGDGDAMPYTADHILAAHLAAPAALEPYIDHVEVARLPAYADADVSMAAGGYTFTSYPTAGTAWSASGYDMPLATDPMGHAIYSIWIDTDNTVDPHPALYQIRVTLLDGSTILYTTRVFFVFHTPPHMLAVEDGTKASILTTPLADGDPGSPSAPLVVDGSGAYTLYASRPLDSAGGSEICGMEVSAEIFYEDAGGRQLNTMVVNTPRTVDSATCDPSVQLSVDLDAADLPLTWDGSAVSTYRVAMMVSGPMGDNAATNLWLTY